MKNISAIVTLVLLASSAEATRDEELERTKSNRAERADARAQARARAAERKAARTQRRRRRYLDAHNEHGHDTYAHEIHEMQLQSHEIDMGGALEGMEERKKKTSNGNKGPKPGSSKERDSKEKDNAKEKDNDKEKGSKEKEKTYNYDPDAPSRLDRARQKLIDQSVGDSDSAKAPGADETVAGATEPEDEPAEDEQEGSAPAGMPTREQRKQDESNAMGGDDAAGAAPTPSQENPSEPTGDQGVAAPAGMPSRERRKQGQGSDEGAENSAEGQKASRNKEKPTMFPTMQPKESQNNNRNGGSTPIPTYYPTYSTYYPTTSDRERQTDVVDNNNNNNNQNQQGQGSKPSNIPPNKPPTVATYTPTYYPTTFLPTSSPTYVGAWGQAFQGPPPKYTYIKVGGGWGNGWGGGKDSGRIYKVPVKEPPTFMPTTFMPTTYPPTRDPDRNPDNNPTYMPTYFPTTYTPTFSPVWWGGGWDTGSQWNAPPSWGSGSGGKPGGSQWKAPPSWGPGSSGKPGGTWGSPSWSSPGWSGSQWSRGAPQYGGGQMYGGGKSGKGTRTYGSSSWSSPTWHGSQPWYGAGPHGMQMWSGTTTSDMAETSRAAGANGSVSTDSSRMPHMGDVPSRTGSGLAVTGSAASEKASGATVLKGDSAAAPGRTWSVTKTVGTSAIEGNSGGITQVYGAADSSSAVPHPSWQDNSPAWLGSSSSSEDELDTGSPWSAAGRDWYGGGGWNSKSGKDHKEAWSSGWYSKSSKSKTSKSKSSKVEVHETYWGTGPKSSKSHESWQGTESWWSGGAMMIDGADSKGGKRTRRLKTVDDFDPDAPF